MAADREVSPMLDLSQKPGRVEITDPGLIANLALHPAPESLVELRQLEEAAILAEQRVGTLRVA